MAPTKKNRIRARFKGADVVDGVEKLSYHHQQLSSSSNSPNGLSAWMNIKERKEGRSPSPDITLSSSFKKKANSAYSGSPWHSEKSKLELRQQEESNDAFDLAGESRGKNPLLRSSSASGGESLERILDFPSSGDTERIGLNEMKSVRTEVIKMDGHGGDFSAEEKCAPRKLILAPAERESSAVREISSLGFSREDAEDSNCFQNGNSGIRGWGDYSHDCKEQLMENAEEERKNSEEEEEFCSSEDIQDGEDYDTCSNSWRSSESTASSKDLTTDEESIFCEEVEEDEQFVLFQDLKDLMKAVELDTVSSANTSTATEPDLNLFNSDIQQAMSCMSDADLTLAAEAMQSELDAVSDCEIPECSHHTLTSDEPPRILQDQQDLRLSVNSSTFFSLSHVQNVFPSSVASATVSVVSPEDASPSASSTLPSSSASTTFNTDFNGGSISRGLKKFSVTELVNCIDKYVGHGAFECCAASRLAGTASASALLSVMPPEQALIFRDHLGSNLQSSEEEYESSRDSLETEKGGERSWRDRERQSGAPLGVVIQAEANVEVNGKRQLGKRISLDEGASSVNVFHIQKNVSSLSTLSPPPPTTFSAKLTSRTGVRESRQEDNNNQSQITFHPLKKYAATIPPAVTEILYSVICGRKSEEGLSENILPFLPPPHHHGGDEGEELQSSSTNTAANETSTSCYIPSSPGRRRNKPLSHMIRRSAAAASLFTAERVIIPEAWTTNNKSPYTSEHREYLYGEGMFLVHRNDLRLYQPGLFPIWRVMKASAGKLLRRFNPLKVQDIQFHYGVDKFVKFGSKRKLQTYYLPVIFALVWDKELYQVGIYFDIPDSTRYLGYFRESASLYDSFLCFLQALALAATREEDSSALEDSNFNELEIIVMQLRNISVSTYFSAWYPPQLLETSACRPKILFTKIKNSETECCVQPCDFTSLVSANQTKYKVSFYGPPYDPDTLLKTGESRLEETEYVLCRTCCICLKHFHDLLHYKYWVYMAFRVQLKRLYKQLSQKWNPEDVLKFLFQDYTYNLRSFYEYQAILGRGIFAREKLSKALLKRPTLEPRTRRNVQPCISTLEKRVSQVFQVTSGSSLTSSSMIPGVPLSADNIAAFAKDLMKGARIPFLKPNKVAEALCLPASKKRNRPSRRTSRRMLQHKRNTGSFNRAEPSMGQREESELSPDITFLGAARDRFNPLFLSPDSLSDEVPGSVAGSIADIVYDLEKCSHSRSEPLTLQLAEGSNVGTKHGLRGVLNNDSSHTSFSQSLVDPLGYFSSVTVSRDIGLSPASTEKLHMESPLGSDFSFTTSMPVSKSSSSSLEIALPRTSVCHFRFPKLKAGNHPEFAGTETGTSRTPDLGAHMTKAQQGSERDDAEENAGNVECFGAGNSQKNLESLQNNDSSSQSVEFFAEEFSPDASVSRTSWSENACGFFENSLCNLPTPSTTSADEKFSPFGETETPDLDYLFATYGRPKIILPNCSQMDASGEDVESRSTIFSSFEIEESDAEEMVSQTAELREKPQRDGLRLRLRKKHELTNQSSLPKPISKTRQSKSRKRNPVIHKKEMGRLKASLINSKFKSASSDSSVIGYGCEPRQTSVRKAPAEQQVLSVSEILNSYDTVFDENKNFYHRSAHQPVNQNPEACPSKSHKRKRQVSKRTLSKTTKSSKGPRSCPKAQERRTSTYPKKKRKFSTESKRPSVVLTFSSNDLDTTDLESSISIPGSSASLSAYSNNCFTNLISTGERQNKQAPKKSEETKPTKRNPQSEAAEKPSPSPQKQNEYAENMEGCKNSQQNPESTSILADNADKEANRLPKNQSSSPILPQPHLFAAKTAGAERTKQVHQRHLAVPKLSKHPTTMAETATLGQLPPDFSSPNQPNSGSQKLHDPWPPLGPVMLQPFSEPSPPANPSRTPTKFVLKAVPSDSENNSPVSEPNVCGMNLPDLNVGYKLSPSLKITLTTTVIPNGDSVSPGATPEKLSRTLSTSPTSPATLAPVATTPTANVITPLGHSSRWGSCSSSSSKAPLREILDSAQKLVDSLSLKNSKGISKSSARCDLSKRFAQVDLERDTS